MSIKYDYCVIFEAQNVGVEVTKSLQFPNKVQKSQILIVPFDQTIITGFTITPTDKNELLITYKPTTANETNDSFYFIKNLTENDQILYVKGESIGRCVIASIKNLVLYRLKNGFKTKSIFELSTESSISVKFQFIIDNNQKIFQIEPKSGVIQAGKHCYINVSFVTEQTGVFLLQLPCLILYGEPVFIDLFGFNALNEDLLYLKQFKDTFVGPYVACNNFEKYTKSHFCDADLQPILQFTANYITFGENHSILVQYANVGNKCIQCKWDIANDSIFGLKFDDTRLRPSEINYLECHFKPTIKDSFFDAILYGKLLFYENVNSIATPETEMLCAQIPISLSFIGNSFTTPNRWFPQIELSSKMIKMPICSPKENVYVTFLIKKNGHLPISFHFLGPKNTNFVVKPTNGIIRDKFQIFVVKFTPQYKFCKTYSEHWKIHLNQSESDYHDISFHADVQIPQLCIGTENVVTFKTTYPGCQQFLTVSITNLTQLCLSDSGNLKCHETVNIEMCYTADYDIPENLKLHYQMWVLQGGMLKVGEAYEAFITIDAKCSYSRICTNPKIYDFYDIICTDTYSTTFTIFNYGLSEINYLLKYVKLNDFRGPLNLKITPDKGVLGPGEHHIITITLITTKIGIFAGCIRYHIRKSRDCDDLIQSDDTFWKNTYLIFKIQFCSFYPTIQVQQVGKNTSGPLFGSLHIWQIFELESFNACLRQIKANETKTIKMRLPDAEFNLGIEKQIIFIVKNISSVETFFKLERKKNCNCGAKEIVSNSSFRKFTYEDCVHRKMMKCHMSNDIVKPRETEFMYLLMKYLLPDTTILSYTLHLSHNRTIELYFHMNGIRPGTISIYHDKLQLSLYGVYLGESFPDLQTFWFYNNTREAARYELNVKILQKLNIRQRCNVLTCLNPEGVVMPKCAFALMFKFAPVHTKYIKIKLPLTMGNRYETFVITGQGTSRFYSPFRYIIGTGPRNDVFYYPGLYVNISTAHIAIRAIPTNCTTTRWLMLKNVLHEDTLGFWFQNYYKEDIIFVTSLPQTGIIKPKETVLIMVKVITFGVAVSKQISLSCRLINKSALLRYAESKSKYYEQARTLQTEFDIGKDGTETIYPTPTIEVEPPPRLFHRCIALSCYIVGSGDLDLKMSISQQLVQEPFNQIAAFSRSAMNRILEKKWALKDIEHTKSSNARNKIKQTFFCTSVCCLTLIDSRFSLIRNVLEVLIRDVLYSKRLRHYIKLMSIEPLFHYQQYLFDETEKEQEREMMTLTMNRIPDVTLSQMLQYLIQDTLMHHFGYGAHPKLNMDECTRNDLEETKHYVKDLYPNKLLFIMDF